MKKSYKLRTEDEFRRYISYITQMISQKIHRIFALDCHIDIIINQVKLAALNNLHNLPLFGPKDLVSFLQPFKKHV